jgi:predicted phosphodiesterase
VRYGVIADVHGNLPALEAVLEALGDLRVDAYACAGDLVGYGPQPNECVDLVRRLGAVTVAGNHDLIAVEVLSDERCERLARTSLRWTREVLCEDARAYLAGLPSVASLPGGVVIAHGSLDDPQRYVLTRGDVARELGRLTDHEAGARVLVVGHTHVALACDGRGEPQRPGGGARVALAGSAWLLNPGAVGQSRERTVRARFLVLDLDRAEAEFHAVRYDTRRARAALRSRGLPAGSIQLAPWRPRRLLRPVVRAGRSAQRALQRR